MTRGEETVLLALVFAIAFLLLVLPISASALSDALLYLKQR